MKKQVLKTIKSSFLHELQNAYAGKKTSLPFITHQLSLSPLVKENEIFEVLIIGGSVWKKAFLKKTKNGIELIKKQTEQPVNLKNERDFLAFIENELPDEVTTLALNFAIPMEMVFENGRLDGIVLSVPKEGKLHGLIGKKVGAEIEKYIFEKQKRRIKASVANDTVCLVLSGLTKYRWNQFVAGIVGTGVNFAFFLKEEKIANLESANFDKFTLSQEARIIDKESREPNMHLFEKETAGAYLYKHFNIIIKNENIKFKPIASTEELSALCHPEFISGSKNKNRKKMLNQVQHDMVEVSEIAQDLLIRSAQLVACQIAGIVSFMDRSMVFNMEGSLFWKGNNYKETVASTVGQLVPEHKVKFVEIENSAILGATKLVS